MSHDVIPRLDTVLVTKLDAQEKSGEIYLPDTAKGELERGRIERISADAFPDLPTNKHPLAVHDVVLYLKNAERLAAIGSNILIVPLSAIVAKEEPSPKEAALVTAPSFFSTCSWSDFQKELPPIGVWRQWENVREFKLDVGFMEPLGPLGALQ